MGDDLDLALAEVGGDEKMPPGDVGVDTAPKAAPKKSSARAPSRTSLERRLTEMYVSVGTMLCAVDLTCGQATIASAPEIGAALDNLAKENKSVAKALEKMLQGGAWGGVVMAHFPIITVVLAHHGILPPQVAAAMGVTPKPSKKPEKPTAEPFLVGVPGADGSQPD